MSHDKQMSEQSINIEFVKEVQKHPSLYNFRLPEYTRKDLTDEAWEKVGRKMNMTPSGCKERWRNLRAVFMRSMRAPPKGFTGKKKPYYLSEVMQFIVPYLRPYAKTDEAREKLQEKAQSKEPSEYTDDVEEIKVETQDEDEDDSSEQSVEEEEEVTFIRKRSVQDEEPPYQSMKVAKLAQPSPSSSAILDIDHVRSFLNSLLPELNEMNSVQFKHFKRRVLLLIDNIVTEIPATPRRH